MMERKRKRTGKAAKKATPTPKIDRSKQAFERAFLARVGQTPREFIETKLAVGSDMESTHYLFDITAAAIAERYGCVAGNFNDYKPQTAGEKKMPKVIEYSKLVRDRIPDLIKASGKKCKTEVLDADAYIKMLDAKLQEELDEYQKSKSLEELADLLEVMGAVVKARGYTWDELTSIRKAKREKCGAFEKRILLKEVIES